MINSKYAPHHRNQYGSKDLNANFQGMKFEAAAGATTAGDLKVTDDHLLDGAEISTVGEVAAGDYFIGQVVDKDNVFGLGAGAILNEFVPKWYLVPGLTRQLTFESQYPAKIFHGLYLRIQYISVGASPIQVIVNYHLHKVLW